MALPTPFQRVENYPDLEKLSNVIEYGLEGFMVKNIEGEPTEENDLSHICRSGSVG